MSYPVVVVGMGPGSEDYLTPCAKRAIGAADVLVGGKRWLRAVSNSGKETLPITSPLEKVIDYIKTERHNKHIAVLVSGDTGLYSLLPRLRDVLGEDALEVIPGISSVQLAFARLKKNWENARILSLHGRKLEGLERDMAFAPLIALFSDASQTPAKIADYLRDKNVEHQTVYVCENMSYPEEKITKTDLTHLAEIEPDDNFFLIFEAL